MKPGEDIKTVVQGYPRLQLITVRELIDGKRPHHPPAMSYAKKGKKALEDLQDTMF